MISEVKDVNIYLRDVLILLGKYVAVAVPECLFERHFLVAYYSVYIPFHDGSRFVITIL